MKKCVKCGTKYDDSEVICPKCNMYLIKDVISDLSEEPLNRFTKNTSFSSDDDAGFDDHFDDVHKESSRRTTKKSGAQSNHTTTFDTGTATGSINMEDTSFGSDAGRRRRNRVHPAEEKIVDTEPVKRRAGHSAFQPSDESDDFEDENVQPVCRRRIRRRRFRQIMRRLLLWFRILLPVLMIVVAAFLVIRNWETVKEFLEACLIGGIIGSVILTFLSIRFGTRFNAEVTITGAISGAIIGCIIRYNLLGSADDLSALLDALMPCVICCVGLYIIVRGTFTRR